MTPVNLTGKAIFITGADGNIVSHLSVVFAKKQSSLILGCYNATKCTHLKNTIVEQANSDPDLIETVSLDLSSIDSINNAADFVLDKYEHLDVLLHAAGTGSSRMSTDGYVTAMEVNVLGPALLTDLLLPILSGGRVVSVAAAVWGEQVPKNSTIDDLEQIAKGSAKNFTDYFELSKFLLIHHAIELAKREKSITAFSMSPGYSEEFAIDGVNVLPFVARAELPESIEKKLPSNIEKIRLACRSNFVGVSACPEEYNQAAAVIGVASAYPGIEGYSGSYLDFDTKILPDNATTEFGPYAQFDPTCVPRIPPPMDEDLRASWFDEMLKLMGKR